MKALKQTLITALTLLLTGTSSISQTAVGGIKGQILTIENEPVFGATIKVTSGGVLVGGTTTDMDGKYAYKPLNPGTYEIIIQSAETQTKQINKIEVKPEKTSYVDAKVASNTFSMVTVLAEDYIEPIVDNSYITMQSMNATEYLHSAGDRMDIKEMAITLVSDATIDSQGDFHVRGGRGDASLYIIDGVKSPAITGVVALSVENLSVITGGIPAQYGDMTSGVIVVTTKDYFSGIRSKRIRETDVNERYQRKLREKAAKAEEEKRKKEIEEELKQEQQKLEQNNG